jgi:hypothetical protein
MLLVTPSLARQYIDDCTHDDAIMDLIMRPIRPDWVQTLARRMAAGQFTPSASIGLAHYNGKTFIVNGNHTLRAIVVSGKAQRLPVIHHDVKTGDELRHLYATYDRGLSRKVHDSLRAYDATNVLGLSQMEVEGLLAALKFMLSDFGRSSVLRREPVSDVDLLEVAQPWATTMIEIRMALEGIPQTERRLIVRRRAVLSSALITMKGQPEKASVFWPQVASGEKLVRTDPAFKLREYLTTTGVMGSNASQVTEPSWRMAMTAAAAWNKFFDGQKVVSLRLGQGRISFKGCEDVALPTRTVEKLLEIE